MILPNKCLQMDIFTLADYQNHLHLVSLPRLYPRPTVSYAPYASSYRGFVCLFVYLFVYLLASLFFIYS